MAQCTPKSFDLTGKVALITGASYGIGMAIAKAMAANGATIVFNDIKQELVDKGLAAYEEAGIKAHGYVCDVTDEDAVNAMVAKITEEVGHINILVNNAGIIKRIPMTEMTAAQFRQVIDVDLNAPFIVAKAVIPDMIAQGGGKIINICSMMSELGREIIFPDTPCEESEHPALPPVSRSYSGVWGRSVIWIRRRTEYRPQRTRPCR